LGLGIAAFTQVGDITGTWETTITINPAGTLPGPPAFFAFETELTVNYIVGGWTFTSFSALDATGWITQTFAADGAFGAFGIDSTIVFDTGILDNLPKFTSLDIGVDYTFGAVAIEIDAQLVPNNLFLTVAGTASTGLVDITATLTFGNIAAGCDLDWVGAQIAVDFPFCCAEVSATIDFTCLNGFEQVCFEVDGIVIPNLPWVTIGAEVCFVLQTKSLLLSPTFSFGDDACFVLYIDEVTTGGGVNIGGAVLPGGSAPLVLGDFQISGISLECEIGGVSFVGVSYWGPAGAGNALKPLILNGTPYWEGYQVSTGDRAGTCCGPFNFDVAVFFDAGGLLLFDVAAFDANFSYAFGESFTFTMGFDYTAAAPGLTLWTIGFIVTWE
jgi:hypothetical protein